MSSRLHAVVVLTLCLCVVCPLSGQTAELSALLDQAKTAQSKGDFAAAASAYAKATALSPATPELWSNRGVMEYLAGQPDASIFSLKHALRLNPKLYTPLLFLGKAYAQTGKPALALPYLNRAHHEQPDDAEVLLTLGKATAALNLQQDAEASYAAAARLAPDKPTAWLGLGTAALAVIATDGQSMADSQAQSIWARALFADELLAQGRPLEATDTYNAALASATPTQTATLTRSVSWLQSHPDLFPLPQNAQEALDKLNQRLQAAPNQESLAPCDASSSLPRSAACAFWAGDYEASAAKASEALRLVPHDPEALYWAIKSNERIAVAALARFEELAPHSATSFVMVGDLYRDQRQMDNALTEYGKALEIDPHDPGALMGSIVADIAGSRLDEAAEMNKAALVDHPDDPQLNLLMAEIFASRNDLQSAKPFLLKCVHGPAELQPRVHLLLARADSEAGKTEDAIREYQIALPGDLDGSIHFQLSRLYRKSGNIALAQRAEDQAKLLIARRRSNAAIEVREMTGANP